MISGLVARLGLRAACGFLARWWPYIAMGLLAVVIGILWLRLDTVSAERDSAELREGVLRDAHNEALQVWDAIEAERERALAALEAAEEAADSRARTINRLKLEIARAPDADDGPVAPVLGRALDGLRADGRAPGGAEAGAADDP